MTFRLEWLEMVGDPPPAWVERVADADDPESELRSLAAGVGGHSGAGRDMDEILIDAVAALGPRSEFVALVDRVTNNALGALREAPSPGSLDVEALNRLLRVVADGPGLFPLTTHRAVALARSGVYTTLPSASANDLSALCLLIAAQSQSDDSLIPLWWRLCELQSLRPDHATLGFIGLRWAPGVEHTITEVLTRAVARLADACVRASAEELMSKPSAQRLFVRTLRTNSRARPDIDWSQLGRDAVSLVRTDDAGVLIQATLSLPQDTSSSPRQPSGEYENPQRAASIVSALAADAANGLSQAHTFLEGQRSHAAKRGDVLPLVQSLSWFSQTIRDAGPEQAERWASEAAQWQPSNEYAVIAWAEALHGQDRSVAATDIVLARLHSLPSAPVWTEAGKSLQLIGEYVAARELLHEATERFPSNSPTWSVLAELHMRLGDTESAAGVFEQGLKLHPENRYLLPGYARALANLGRRDEALGQLDIAERLVDAPHDVIDLRRKQIASAEPLDVPPLSPPNDDVPHELSAEAAGELALILRRAVQRGKLQPDERDRAVAEHEAIIGVLRASQVPGIVASAESFLSTGSAVSGPAPPAIHEVVRTRAARSENMGRAYDPESFSSMVFDAEVAGAGDARAIPLVELSRLRAFGAVRDGQRLDSEARRAVDMLMKLPRMPDGRTSTFGPAYMRSFGAGAVLSTLKIESEVPETEHLRNAIEQKADQLDDLEEDLALVLMR